MVISHLYNNYLLNDYLIKISKLANTFKFAFIL